MENTDACSDERQKSEVVCGKLIRKVDEMWHKTYDMRRRICIFYEDVVLPLAPPEEKKENEMIFYLRENPNCQVQAVGIWREDTNGEVIGDVDTYFIHILTGRRCESVRDCATGWSEPEKKEADEWESLCQHIEDLRGIEEIICTEKRVEV